MDNVVVGTLVIYKSPNGETDWTPIMPDEVPAWLNKPSTIGMMVDGFLAHDPEKGPEWFAAVRIPDKSREPVRAAEPEANPEPVKIREAQPRIILPGNKTGH